MQLIKDFSDIPRFVTFLNSDYQQKLLSEINSLLVKFMDEQTRGVPPSSSTENLLNPAISTNNQVNIVNNPENIVPIAPPPIINQNSNDINDPSNSLNNLKTLFNKGSGTGNFVPPPPPPPPSSIPNNPVQMGRSIASGGFNLKANMSNTRSSITKKTTISVVEALEYITPVLSEVGENLLKNPAISTETYKLLKQINGNTNLKEIYLFLNPSSNLWGKFLEKIYPMYHERALNLRKSRSYPSDLTLSLKLGEMVVALGLIDETTLEKSLEYQKNPPQQQEKISQQPIQGQSWIERTKSLVGQQPEIVSPANHVAKKRLGDILIEMRLITKDELDNVVTLQKWIKNIIEHS